MPETQQKFLVSLLKDAEFESGQLRSYFHDRDIGVSDATGGKVTALVHRAAGPCPADVRVPHLHKVDFQMNYVLKGWCRFEFERSLRLAERAAWTGKEKSLVCGNGARPKSLLAERRISEDMLGVDHDPFGVDQNYPVNRSLMRVPRLLDQGEIQRQLMVGRKKRRERDLSPVTANRSMCVTKEDMTQVVVPVDGRDEVVDIH